MEIPGWLRGAAFLVLLAAPATGDYCNTSVCLPPWVQGVRITYQSGGSGGLFSCCNHPENCVNNPSGGCFTNSQCGSGSYSYRFQDCIGSFIYEQ